MSGYLIDLFFSFKGRASRLEWLLGSAVICAAAIGGVIWFNDASFDDSANNIPEIPTMAAFIWAVVCLVAFLALSVKRLSDSGQGRLASLAVVVLASLLVLGWSTGNFAAPLSSLAFWALTCALIVALAPCALTAAKG